jgi:hypothetical protein
MSYAREPVQLSRSIGATKPQVLLIAFGCLISAVNSAGQLSTKRTVHVCVALADNQNQGIVPVPARLGNGLDPGHNLYWGAAGGVKTFFVRSSKWILLNCQERPTLEILERCVFQHRVADVDMVADA